MDTTFTIIVGLLALLILGSGIVWFMSSKEGSYAWQIKTRLFEASSHIESETQPDIQQIQRGGEGNSQIASKEGKSRQEQIDGTKNKQEIK